MFIKKLTLISTLTLIIFLLSTSSCRKDRVRIKGQVWMQKNLDVDKFRNGDPIFEAKTKEEWVLAAEAEEPAWCYYENKESNGEKYGKLYNWHAVKDPRGLAPEGWKIPSIKDFETLISNLGKYGMAGYKMKSRNGWYNKGGGSNESGFNGKPSGARDTDGVFFNINRLGYWWTIDEAETYSVFTNVLSFHNNELEQKPLNKACGVSIRCIKN